MDMESRAASSRSAMIFSMSIRARSIRSCLWSKRVRSRPIGAFENNRKARFYRLTREGAGSCRPNAELGTDGGDHCAILRGESGRSRMRTLRRFFKQLTSWASAQRRRTAARESKRTSRFRPTKTFARFTAGEARREAVEIRTVEAIKDSYREQRGLPSVEALIQDTRYALRRLRMAPTFTIATILTLALGIGATTSIFTLVHAVLLKSLPVANPSELVRLGKETRCCYWSAYEQSKEHSLVSYDLYRYFLDDTKEFAELSAFSASTHRLGVRRAGGTEPAQSYPGEFVSGNYFATFGITHTRAAV